ncbi:MAG: type II/IV secretion system protein [Candidatus Niyogibacteria bacterium]|nr:type II/IV secretion system protein [Candidatus Niyogibacteria bacterium]
MKISLSKKGGLPALPEQYKDKAPKSEVLGIMPPEVISEFQAFIFDKKDNTFGVAAVNPQNPALQRFLKDNLPEKSRIEWHSATKHNITSVLKFYIRDFSSEIGALVGVSKFESNGNIAKLVDTIIDYGFSEKASDIHIEPLRYETAVRFRVDGMLHPMASIPRDIHPAVVARFKILSNLKIDEYRRPQDGRIEPEHIPDASLRISIIPTLYGEKIALRILDDSHKNLMLQNLGFSEKQADILMRNIEKPFGMIVTSGPTGSGKTTTLYALLQLLKKDGMNISTLEDPIEYALAGVNQIQANVSVGLTFASGLRALLRQDPDVIMVGEIRDSETVIMAANAAMTGHLVFTTMHTNDAPSAFTRFLEMKVEDFVVASIVNLVIAQRLVRTVCESCAEKDVLPEAIVKKIRERKDILNILEEEHGIKGDGLAHHKFARGKGCKACLKTGYLGRTGIYEVLEMNKEIHTLVLNHAPAEKIREAAQKAGFVDMLSDGIKKVMDGSTTFEEVLRTTRLT